MSLVPYPLTHGVNLSCGLAEALCPRQSFRGATAVVFCAAFLAFQLAGPGTSTAHAATVELRPAISSDDAEESPTGGMYLSSSDLEMTFDKVTQTVGIRWAGLSIPRGASITAAWVQFAAVESHGELTTLTLRGQAADNAPTFATGTGRISIRPLTTASLAWSPLAWTSGQAGPNQRTPDLSAIVQELVSRPGWTSGNALALIVTGTGHRTARSWDGGAATSPLLHVEYSTGPVPDLPPVANLNVTQVASPPLTVTASGAGSTDTDATPIATYRFDFGDGTPPVVTTAPTATATHTYADVATYTVTLIVTDTGGQASTPVSQTISVNPPPPDFPPVANLSVSQVASPPLTVSASGAGSTDTDLTPIASYRFDFGDGSAPVVTTAPTATTTHTYAAAGAYTVTLVVTDTAPLESAPVTANVTVSDAVAATLEKRTAASSEDAEEAAAGSVSLSSSDLELVFDSSVQTVGMRWTGITIPRGAAITAAWVQFTADEAHTEATNLTLRGQAVDNAPTFTTTARNISLRTRTTAAAAWSPLAWTANQAGANQRTPDLSGVIQEIVNRSGWASGNALALIVTGTGHRTADSWDGSSASAPLLHIEYLTGPPPEAPPVARLSVAQIATPPLTVSANGAASSDIDLTPIATYRFDFGDGSPAVVTTAPTAMATHTYAAVGTYTVTLLVTDTGGFVSSPVTASVTVSTIVGPPVAVHVGYYDTHHPDNPRPKPDPWMGSPGIVFVGTPDSPSGGWDSSALKIDNLSSASISVLVKVDIGSNHYNLWGTRSIPAGGTLVLAQTAFENFDGSDTNPAGCYGCDPRECLTMIQSTVPVVHVTLAGTTTDYFDTGQILNTYGVDAAGCPPSGGRNDESSPWTRIYATAPGAPTPGPSSALQSKPGTTRAGASWLAPPYPNPVRDELALRFSTALRGPVHLAIYDVAGRLVQTAMDRELEPGEYRKVLSIRGTMAGRYFARLRTPEGMLHQSFVITH